MRKAMVGMVLTGLLAALLTGCQRSTPLPPAEAQAFADQIDEKVENTLIGLSEKDYEQHTADFDQEMLEAVDPVSFPTMYDEIIGKLGHYQSKELVEVLKQQRFYVAIYEARFDNDPAVRVRVVFWQSDPEQKITGLWFDSALLREE